MGFLGIQFQKVIRGDALLFAQGVELSEVGVRRKGPAYSPKGPPPIEDLPVEFGGILDHEVFRRSLFMPDFEACLDHQLKE